MNAVEITTHSPEETRQVAIKIGRHIKPGTVIALTGDLGSGKTSFVQGLAVGLDVPEEYYITSPTFTLINEYPGRYKLYHVDIYRLDSPDDFEETGLYDVLTGDGITAVEWAEKLGPDLPENLISINIKILNDTSRNLSIKTDRLQLFDLVKLIET